MSDLGDKIDCPTDNPTTKVKRVYASSEQTSLLNRIQDDQTYVVLDLPPCLKGFNVSNCGQERDISLNSLEMKIRSFPIPEITIEHEKIQHGVGSFTQSSESLADTSPITISFSLDDKLVNYYTLYKWMNMLVDIKKGTGTKYCKADYSTVFHSFVLNQKRKPIGCYTFHNVIPTTLGGFNLDNTSTGEDIFIDFTFDYDYMTFDMRDGKSLNQTNF